MPARVGASAVELARSFHGRRRPAVRRVRDRLVMDDLPENSSTPESRSTDLGLLRRRPPPDPEANGAPGRVSVAAAIAL